MTVRYLNAIECYFFPRAAVFVSSRIVTSKVAVLIYFIEYSVQLSHVNRISRNCPT